MQLLKSTQSYLSNFASYCRTGILKNIPGVYQRNVELYQKLVLNVIDENLQNAYPIANKLLIPEEWDKLVQDFIATHACKSNQVWLMPKEFYDWFTGSNHNILNKYFYLDELLWFELIELEMFMMEDEYVSHTKLGDILFSKLVLNPEHRVLSFKFPVHLKNCKDITLFDKGNYFVIVNRNSKGEILFNEISAPIVRVIEYLKEQTLSISEIIERFQKEFLIDIAENDQKMIINFIENAYKQELIIGFKK